MSKVKMMRRVVCAALVALVWLPAAAREVDLVVYNGKVVTADSAFSIANAVAVDGGVIVAVGGNEVERDYTGRAVIDLAGRTLLPGFIDTHLHLQGRSRRQIDAASATSIVELNQMIAAKAAELGPNEWITGYGWDEAKLAEGRVPVRGDLDQAAPSNPVVLTRAGSHSAVGNSAALAAAGITRDTPDPDGGLIEHDAAGEPNGVVRERTQLYTDHVPVATPAELRPSYVASLRALLSLGITSFMEAFSSIDDEPVGAGGAPGVPRGHSFKQFRSIYDEFGDQLPRVALYIGYPGAERLRAFPHKTGYGDARLRLGPIGENPYDGGFTGPTALTKADYRGRPGFRGTALMSRAAAQEMIDTSAALGWQLGIHAIGDAAIEQVVEMYHAALARYPRKDHRWFLSHFTMLPSEATMDRMARDGIYAAAQPNFLYNLEGRYVDTLDGVRLEHINPVGSPLRHGVFVAFSSDNLPIGPLVGIYAATTRMGSSGRVFGPDEAVTRRQAIEMYTRDGAYFTWEERQKGSLEPGKFADMIVLDRDPLTVAADQLLATRVDLTIVAGRIVYRRPGAP